MNTTLFIILNIILFLECFIVGYLVHERTNFRFNKIAKYLKKFLYYLKNKEEINHNYGYAFKKGFISDETYNWFEKTDYYEKTQAYEPLEEDE